MVVKLSAGRLVKDIKFGSPLTVRLRRPRIHNVALTNDGSSDNATDFTLRISADRDGIRGIDRVDYRINISVVGQHQRVIASKPTAMSQSESGHSFGTSPNGFRNVVDLVAAYREAHPKHDGLGHTVAVALHRPANNPFDGLSAENRSIARKGIAKAIVASLR